MAAEDLHEMRDPEMVFRTLRKSLLEEYERNLEQVRADRETEQAIGRRVGVRAREIFERSNLDIAGADSLAEAERGEMDGYLARIRRQFTERDPERAQRLHTETERALDLIQSGWSRAHLTGADVLDIESERDAGEVGNPATWLYEANQSWKGKTSVSGEAWCTSKTPYHPAGTIWYFTWPATMVGPSVVSVFLGYYGFKILYAVPVPFQFCAAAGATVTAKLYVYQQVGYPKYSKILGQDMATILDESISGGVLSGQLDGFTLLSADVNITSVSLIYIAVTLSLQVHAMGPVSYAELNCQDGTSNYVLPPIVAIKPGTP